MVLESVVSALSALSLGGKRTYISSESLCDSLDRARTLSRNQTHSFEATQCPLAPGPQQLLFDFKHFPKEVLAGKYRVEVSVTDVLDRPVSCAEGHMEIQKGPSGKIFGALPSRGSGAGSSSRLADSLGRRPTRPTSPTCWPRVAPRVAMAVVP